MSNQQTSANQQTEVNRQTSANQQTVANRHSIRVRAGLGLFSIALMAFGAVAGGMLYQLIVEVPNWSADIPGSLQAYREFFQVSHAGFFFQVLVPLTILCLIGATILLWNRPKSANFWMLGVLGGVIFTEAFTLIYFLPRIMVLFLNPLDGVAPDQLSAASVQWQAANYLRMVIVLATMGVFLRAYRMAGKNRTVE